MEQKTPKGSLNRVGGIEKINGRSRPAGQFHRWSSDYLIGAAVHVFNISSTTF
jgi:hypothetical protein